MTKRMTSAARVAALIVAAVAAPSAQAKFVITLQQNGADVIGMGSGTLDLTDFGSSVGSTRLATELAPNGSVISAGSGAEPGPDVSFFNGPIIAPSNFGPGGMTIGESIGDPVFYVEDHNRRSHRLRVRVRPAIQPCVLYRRIGPFAWRDAWDLRMELGLGRAR